MTSERATGSDRQRFEEAADWYLRLRSELSAEDLVEWQRWFAVPENQEALELMKRVTPLHGRLRRPDLLSAAQVQADQYDGSISVSDWRSARTSHGRQRRFSGSLPKRRGLWLAVAASVGAVTLFSGVGLYEWLGNASEPSRVYETGLGEHFNLTLSDGSQVTLGALTSISTQYSPSQRTVVLDGGEALFTVAKNPRRPFTVVAAGGTVTAVGTMFNVRSDLNRVTVTVTEGAVDVEPVDAASGAVGESPHRSNWQSTRLMKGQEVTYDEAQGRSSVAPAPAGATEWRSGRLQYRQIPLKYVAADVQRYSNKTIVLADAGAGDFEFTGTIYQTGVDDWFRALEKIFPVQVSQTDTQVLIQSLAPPHESVAKPD